MPPTHSPKLPVRTAAILQPSSDPDSPPLVEFGERLVCLASGRRGLRSGLPVQIEVPSLPDGGPDGGADATAPAVIDFIASSEALDRSDEIILASGWRLDNYRRNPVFQNAHQYGDVIFTLGRALITEVRLNAAGKPFLFQRVEFAVHANPMARIAYGLYRGKFLNAVSVGFIPWRWENGGPGDPFRRRYLEQELLEVSAVGIPANPEALQLGLKAGVIEKSDLRELADLCARALDCPSAGENPAAGPGGEPAGQVPTPAHGAGPEPHFPAALPAHTGALGVESNEAQMFQLARALRESLRRT